MCPSYDGSLAGWNQSWSWIFLLNNNLRKIVELWETIWLWLKQKAPVLGSSLGFYKQGWENLLSFMLLLDNHIQDRILNSLMQLWMELYHCLITLPFLLRYSQLGEKKSFMEMFCLILQSSLAFWWRLGSKIFHFHPCEKELWRLFGNIPFPLLT